MNKNQPTTWTCGHNQPPRSSFPSDQLCPKCETRGVDYYRPRQEHQRANYYRPIYSRSKEGTSGVQNARDEKYHNQTRPREDDRRKKKMEMRQTRREQMQYEEAQMKRRELVRMQNQYEEERERQQYEENCPCDMCSIERQEKLDSKIHKWLAATEGSCSPDSLHK